MNERIGRLEGVVDGVDDWGDDADDESVSSKGRSKSTPARAGQEGSSAGYCRSCGRWCDAGLATEGLCSSCAPRSPKGGKGGGPPHVQGTPVQKGGYFAAGSTGGSTYSPQGQMLGSTSVINHPPPLPGIVFANDPYFRDPRGVQRAEEMQTSIIESIFRNAKRETGVEVSTLAHYITTSTPGPGSPATRASGQMRGLWRRPATATT